MKTTVNPAPLWDPEVLARIAHLHIQARGLVQGLHQGAHRSVRSAANVEFTDYKEYSPGDPLRDIDWRVLARTDRLVVRRHRAEEELGCLILLDASADLATGKGSRYPLGPGPYQGTKWSWAVVLAASLALAALRRGEPVGLAIIGGESVRWPYLPLATGDAHLTRILGNLASIRPAGRADLAAGLLQLGPRLRKGVMTVLVSDLMEEPSSWGPTLASLRSTAMDLRIVHVHDTAEWAFSVGGPARYHSPEGGPALPVDPLDVRPRMAAAVAEYLAEVRTWAAQAGALHLLAASDTDLGLVLARLLRGRS